MEDPEAYQLIKYEGDNVNIGCYLFRITRYKYEAMESGPDW